MKRNETVKTCVIENYSFSRTRYNELCKMQSRVCNWLVFDKNRQEFNIIDAAPLQPVTSFYHQAGPRRASMGLLRFLPKNDENYLHKLELDWLE